MLTASTPGAPLFAWTFRHASEMRRFRISNDFAFDCDLSVGSSPDGVDLWSIWPARPLRSSPITGPSSLLRAVPPQCLAVLCPSQFQLLGVLPLATRGQPSPIYAGRQYRGDWFSCSMPAPATSSRHLYTGRHQGHTQAAPWLRASSGYRSPLSRGPDPILGFGAVLKIFDASAVVYTCSSSRHSPDPVLPGLFPKRSPPRLLTVAASGGLGSPPARRTRRVDLHHWHSTVRAGGYYVTITLLSGHTTRKLVNRAKTVDTSSTPRMISTIPNTTNQESCPEKLRSPYPTVATVSTVK